MLKKLVSIFVSATILMSFAACSQKGKLSPKNPVAITLWHYYHGVQQTAIDEIVKEFNITRGLEIGVAVETVSFGGINEVADSVLDSANEKVGAMPMPDVFSSYSDSALELAKMGKLVNLEEYFTQKELDEYVGDYINEGRLIDGHLNVFPIAKSSEIFMLNKTDWDKFANAADTPVSLDMLDTWEGILKVSEAYYSWTDGMSDEPNDGKAFFGLDSAANYLFICARQLGNSIITLENGVPAVTVSRDTIKKLWDSFYVPVLKGHFAALGRFRSDDVKTGDLLCFVGSTASAAYFPTQIEKQGGDIYDITAYVAPYPVFEGGSRVVIQQGAGMCVTKSTPQRERASAEFLKWFTAKEQNIKFAISSAGYIPVKNDAVQGDEMSKVITELAASGKPADENLVAVMQILIDQTGDGNVEKYAAPPFENSYKFRGVLEALKAQAADSRAQMLEEVAKGKDYESELNARISDSVFEEFLAGLKV